MGLCEIGNCFSNTNGAHLSHRSWRMLFMLRYASVLARCVRKAAPLEHRLQLKWAIAHFGTL
ncbi:MAG: hypothetical protein VKL59_21265 [Nostocaceae cyanobacterium]|nr:hypothetical protein [Nostocaceae cyanobacterium]